MSRREGRPKKFETVKKKAEKEEDSTMRTELMEIGAHFSACERVEDRVGIVALKPNGAEVGVDAPEGDLADLSEMFAKFG